MYVLQSYKDLGVTSLDGHPDVKRESLTDYTVDQDAVGLDSKGRQRGFSFTTWVSFDRQHPDPQEASQSWRIRRSSGGCIFNCAP